MTIINNRVINKSTYRLLFLLLISSSIYGYAQQPPVSSAISDERPKVGLVLSGGGAKGLAHIGALKAIEEAGVKIDYVGGTSMGAIIGALYASGYTVKQLDSLFEYADFDRLIQDDLSRRSKTFYEKEDAEKYAITLPFNNFKVSFPSALSKGQNIYNLMVKLTQPVAEIRDFSELPIPFFCIATDVEKGKQVMLEEGYLPQAITASGALPSLFSPVLLNGRMLIDGGVVNNFPVDEMRAKGMDIIIGVDVQDDLRERKDLQSAPEILLQINNYRTINDMVKKVEKTDVYIKPDITDFTVVSFDRGREIVDAGEQKAKEQITILQDIAARQGQLTATETPVRVADSIRIDAISIKGNQKYTRAYVLGKLKIRTPEKLSWRDFMRSIENLAATENFGRIDYKLLPVEAGQLLVLNLEESEVNTYIKLAVHYDDLYKSAAMGNITSKGLLLKNDVFSFDLALGDNIRYLLNYHKDQGYYISYGMRLRHNTFESPVEASLAQNFTPEDLSSLSNITIDYKDFTNQFYLQTLFDKEFLLEVGVEHKFLEIDTETLEGVNQGRSTFTFESSNFYSTYGKLLLDTMDDRYFPTDGWYFNGDFHLYLFSSDFNENFSEFSIAKAEMKYAKLIASKFSLLAEGSGGFKLGETGVQSLDFFLGGFGNNFINGLVPFYGYDFVSVTGDSYLKASFTLDYEIFPKNHINVGLNYANIEDDLLEGGDWLRSPEYSGYFVGYGLETFMGPMQAKYSFSPETEKGVLFLSLGFWF
ncbi:patatin-like phospholipase family protein [Croceiramulus getboli]|nr:patatin-like phospholipase family protein [Flavobacteriaceae bacterium YJPT1-3]